MLDWFTDAPACTHTVAALVLLGRAGDVISTRLVTPTLRLETNAVVRRLGWRFAWASVLLVAVPYYSSLLGVAVAATSLLVAGQNLARGWMFRALGEEASEELLLSVAVRSRPSTALTFIISGAAFVVLAGVVLMSLSGSAATPSYWFGVGIVIYGLAVGLHGSAFALRLFRRAAAGVRAT